MKIDPSLSFPESHQPQRAGQSGRSPAQSRAEVSPAGHDEVHLSVSQEKIRELQAELAHLPDVRQDRVEALQRALQGGNYQVSNVQIADAVFSELLEQTLFEE